MDCLDDNQVLAYVEHEMDTSTVERVVEHLETCERCLALTRAVVSTLVEAVPTTEAVGEHLATWTARPGRTWREIVRVYAAAGRGLAAAHGAGIVHRGFQPANVMIDAAGQVAVGEFGLALAETGEDGAVAPDASAALGDPLLTRTAAVLATPRNMSAEHFDGEVDSRSDQFAFAVALYGALYGKPPFEGTSVAELRRALDKPVPAKPPNPAVPIAIHRAIVRALAIDPVKRWPSMSDLVDALDVAIRPSSTKWFVAFALAVTAAVVGGAVIMHELKKPPLVVPSTPTTSKPFVTKHR